MSRVWLGKHRFHINKLEAILRMVDNGALQFEEVNCIFIYFVAKYVIRRRENKNDN